MDHFVTIWSVTIFIENRLQGPIDYRELEEEIGFSLAHIRAVFVEHTGKPLAAYIRERKIANAAFDLLHTDHSVLSIGEKYGFHIHDSFTRAFKRMTGYTPTEFRKAGPAVNRVTLCAGVRGIGLPKKRAEEKMK